MNDLKRLSLEDRSRAVDSMERYAATGLGDVVPVKGRRGIYRLEIRGAHYRILFSREKEPRRLVVVRVPDRGSAYK